MNQPDLFVEPKPFINGRSVISRSCSQAGAQQIQPNAGSQADWILWYLRRGGFTLHELADRTGLPITTVCARIGWLRKQGLVRPSGSTRPGPTGVPNYVIVATASVAEADKRHADRILSHD